MKMIDRKEFKKVLSLNIPDVTRLELFATMCRYNTLVAVKKAGSGHLGSSFSAMDIVVYLYLNELNVLKEGFYSINRDIYFSSKGHDVPGLYSVFYALGIIEKEKFLKLRRLGGLDGHPDVRIKGIESNTGSLGMGISKGKGILWAKKYLKANGNVFVLIGDGEIQEGQIFESLQSTAHQKLNELIVLVDRNKYQTDKLVSDINDIDNLEEKVKAFRWEVFKINGHNFSEIKTIISKAKNSLDKPKMIICDTIKGKGVSFMEGHEKISLDDKPFYKWHSGAPDDNSYIAACSELEEKINILTNRLNIPSILFTDLLEDQKISTIIKKEFIAEAYGDALCEIAEKRKDLIVIDGDLSADCRIRNFEKKYPSRFIENGIAEQDMVSMAGGLARIGLLPVVNTFSSFLCARANEQIYNNACEKTKIIYVAHYAGFIPAGPGKSHQSVRDISLFGSIPNMMIIQPANSSEAKQAMVYCVDSAKENSMLRLNIGPSPGMISLPNSYLLEKGKGVILSEGKDAVIFAYGPVLLHEVLEAGIILKHSGVSVRVINHPFLNRFNKNWLKQSINDFDNIFSVDDHFINGGFCDLLLSALVEFNILKNKNFFKLGLLELPECGAPLEVLKYHGLDSYSIAEYIYEKIKSGKSLKVNRIEKEYSKEAPQ